MYYLSRVELDTSRKRTQEALISRNKLHGAIEESLITADGVRNRTLWRIDRLYGKTYLLILSNQKPDFHMITEQFGAKESGYESKDYDTLLNRLRMDTMWRFRLVANPTMCRKNENGRGKRVAHVTPHYQIEWLKRQAEKNGFEIIPEETFVMESGWLMFNRRGERMIRALAVTYEGMLRIVDLEKFKSALLNGIGREKAYGMGLLTIIRVMG